MPATDPAGVLIPNHVTVFDGLVEVEESVFHALVVAEDRPFLRTASWVVGALGTPLVHPGEVVWDRNGTSTVVRTEDTVVWVELDGVKLTVWTAARDRAAAGGALAEVRRRFPEEPPRDDDSTRVTFWNWSSSGTSERPRNIDTPPWTAIAGNYATSIVTELSDLMQRTAPPDGGRLLLWHGPPGTGKTHLIRALAHAWKSWCATDYVVDIDQLLHGGSEYLMSLLLDERDDLPEDRWRLLVLEDAGEFLAGDAARTQGQGFARLLNTLDGMLGQGTRLMVLVTTNWPLTKLDPAITRPGRCAMTLEVPPLPAGEAATWLKAHGHAGPVGGEATLAELFGVLRGDEPPAARRAVGFAV